MWRKEINMTEKSKQKVDLMVWYHLAKLSNLAGQTDSETAGQMQQSINRIIAILSGEHKQEDEPESVKALSKIQEILAS
jgi:macrodomain Ter protein organizer (MatP/YcbG family)